jgi:hypothetical protein
MVEPTQRALLISQITTLQREQREFTANAMYAGWTREVEAAYEKRASRIAAMRFQLSGLPRGSERRTGTN